MMREIKFRAWDGREMYEPILADGKVFRDGRDYEDYVDYPNDVIMQYTGLHDKNEEEIYEGDIVKIDDDWEKYGFAAGTVGNVVYTNSAKFAIQEFHEPYAVFTFESDSHGYTEIIGNIYENPELIPT